MRNGLFMFALVAGSSAVHAGDDVSKSLQAVVSAENYSFSVQDNAKAAVEVKYQKGMPIWMRAEGIEFFRKGDVLVYKDGDTWQRSRTGTLSDPLRILGALAKVRVIQLPHE